MSDAVRHARALLLSCVGLAVIGASLMAPWAFGCIHPGFHLGLISLIVTAAVCWIPLLLTNQLPRTLSVWHLSPLLLFVAVCLLQTVKLPAPLLQLASPSSAAIQAELVPVSREIDALGDPISLAAWSTNKRVSVYPAETWKHTTWFLTLLTLFVIAQTTATTKFIHRLLVALTINGAVLAFIAIATFLTADKSRLVTWEWTCGAFTFGNFLNRNHFAFYTNLCFGAGLGVWVSRYQTLVSQGSKATNDSQLMLLSTALVTMLTGILICQSRGGISSTLFAFSALGVYFFRNANVRGAKVAFAFVGLFTLVVAFAFWVDGALLESRIVTFLSGNEVVDVGRVGLWQRLSILVSKFPLLGTGVGTIPFIEPFTRNASVAHIVKYAHNDYLQVLLETGVFGFAGIALFLVRLGGCSSHVKAGSVGVGVLFALAAAAFHSTVDFSMRMPGVAAVVAVFAACLVAAFQVASDRNKTRGVNHSVWLRGAVVLGVVLALSLSVRQFSSLNYASDLVAKFDESNDSDPNRTLYLTKAVEAYPTDAAWQLLLAEQLAERSDESAIQDSELVVIQRHSVAARDLCPLFSSAQADLAQLVDSFAAAEPAATYLQRARLAHPTSETLFYLSGIEQMHRKRKDLAILSWRKSLELSQIHLKNILMALSEMPGCMESDLESVVPDDADRLYRASQIAIRADRPLLSSESLRVAWLRRASDQLGQLARTVENSKEIYRRAEIAASIGQVEQAISDYGTAVSLSPNEKRWRYQFAKYLVSTNRIPDAQNHLRRLVRMDEHPQAAKLLREISADVAKRASY